jgi:hypothetical protein
MSLVSFTLRVFDWLRKKKSLVQGRAQSHGCLDIAFQVSNDGSALRNPTIGCRNVSADCQRNSNDAIQVLQGGRILKVHDVH